MSAFARIATRIRHSSLLEKSEWLWDILRKPYHALLNIKGGGITVNVNDHMWYKIPPQYYQVGLEDYEKINVEQLINWVSANPECYVLDLGCSIGIMTVAALFASDKARVISFDSDISSLKATLNITAYASGERLEIVWGLISEKSNVKRSIDEVTDFSYTMVSSSNVSGKLGTTGYVNLDHGQHHVPIYSLDDLFEGKFISGPILMKCDIEGAELLALNGGINFIKNHAPVILVSVHPEILPVFNGTVKGVADFFEAINYQVDIIGIDHEQHWWCRPRNEHIKP